MIWHIKQCKYCTIKQSQCLYYKNIKIATDYFLKQTHVSHNCPEYKKLWEPGELVKIEMFDQYISEEHHYQTFYDWESKGNFTGKIYSKKLSWERWQKNTGIDVEFTGKDLPIITSQNFYSVLLDEPLECQRIRDGKQNTELIEIAVKPANKIIRLK